MFLWCNCSHSSQPKSCWKARHSFSFLWRGWLIRFRHPHLLRLTVQYKDKLAIEIPHPLNFDSFVAHWRNLKDFFHAFSKLIFLTKIEAKISQSPLWFFKANLVGIPCICSCHNKSFFAFETSFPILSCSLHNNKVARVEVVADVSGDYWDMIRPTDFNSHLSVISWEKIARSLPS